MYRRIVLTFITAWLLMMLASIESLAANAVSDLVQEHLRSRIEATGVPPQIVVGEERIHASTILPQFYERRVYQPAWSGDDGPLPRVEILVNAIRAAKNEGLNPADYHLAKIEATLAEIRQTRKANKPFDPGPSASAQAGRLTDLELLLTDAFLIYGSHLLAGRVNPVTFDPEWYANRREADLAAILQKALSANQIVESLQNLLPPQAGYVRLQHARAHYAEISTNGGWVQIPDRSKLLKGSRGERVIALRRRLIASGDLDAVTSEPEGLFDNAVDTAVRRFQGRHGLDADGVVGPATLAALNVPVQERVRQLELNMERWRWLPQNLGKYHILVNIAGFELEVVEDGKIAMEMRVVVGRDYRRTPVFSAKMTYLVLSPYWHTPSSIAVKDKLPLIKKDLNYLAEQRMRIFQGWGAEAKEIDPKTVDWSKVNAENFNYRIRQDPGPLNALGRVKFMFPNHFGVYLHDTPSRELFAKTERAFSSGCIRIEKPIELAEYLLRKDPKWSREAIEATIKKQVEQTVQLPQSVNVHLLYWTAYADDKGTLHFRKDIYGRDKLLDEALHQKPPTAKTHN